MDRGWLSVVAVLLLAGCGGEPADPLEATDDQERAIAELCQSGGRLDFAVEPTAAGPNNMTLVLGNDRVGWTNDSPRYLGAERPANVVTDSNDIAYVACFEAGAQTQSYVCVYSDVYSVTYHDTTYEVRVVEAASGSVVDQMSVSSIGDGECPNVLATQDELNEPTRIDRSVRPASVDVRSFLERWTTGSES